MRFTTLAVGAMVMVSSCGAAQAADLSGYPVERRPAAAACQAWGDSALAREPNISVVQQEIEARYAEARTVSVQLSTEASRSERITWAYASRTACGIALGMLSMREVDPDRLWNCECYHARMRATMSRRD
ncbi:hypothetical protein FG93_04554 [Bosea sp. LC85]|uniref:hypothetical protein n=1 Tax=Bosea sp. LC85 TaxID=1502851 RepID=UPI0004E3BC85|nr:hypothetical protein [Bosea sp. LC85]KFC65738.1 hypothetical protein FG93_04554 [Bosea sp. LC85]